MPGGIVDHQIAWKTGHLWLPIRSFTGFDNNGTDDISLGGGTPIMGPVSAIEMAFLLCDTADEVQTVVPIPQNLDRSKAIIGRIHYSKSNTDDDAGLKWRLRYRYRAAGEALAEVGDAATVDEQLEVTEPTSGTTANVLKISKPLTFTVLPAAADIDVLLGVECETRGGTASADEWYLIGLDLEYTIQACDPDWIRRVTSV